MADLQSFITSEFPKRRVVIVGDVVADQFLHGTISRVSREAPVFILNHETTDTRAGGAANAAANVASLSGRSCIVGVVGNDENGRLLCEALTASNVDCKYVVETAERRTTTKVRVLAGQHYAPRQQVIRIDYANDGPFPADLTSQLIQNFNAASEGADAIIFSDYGHGAAGPEIFEVARQRSVELGIPLIVDSRHRLSQFAGATAATPNQEEAEQILGRDFAIDGCGSLRERLGYKSLLVTRGNKGMMLFEEGRQPRHFDAVGSKEPVDVTGAGDTVIGTFALCLASGLSFSEAAEIANHAGGIVVMKRGTSVATAEELIGSLDSKPEDLSQANRI